MKKPLDPVGGYGPYIMADGEGMDSLTIGQVARLAGAGVETIRFYERSGLLERPSRNESGYRIYSEKGIRRIGFIMRAKELGFSLKEIKELLDLRADGSRKSASVKRQARRKLSDIQSRIRSLGRIEKALIRLVAACDGKGTIDDCPILKALDSD